LISRNFYWLSTNPETLDWEASERDPTGQYAISTWTPTKVFADYTALNTLPQVDLDVTAQLRRRQSEGVTMVTLRNPGRTLAFAVRLKVKRASAGYVSRLGTSDDEVLPVLWQDNYFSLLPAESRQVTATYNVKDLAPSVAVVQVEGWNVKTKLVQP
jgi:exo-1,4-beta-D-glucosaminidase